MEKASVDRGWISPAADEQWNYGYHGELDHFIHAYIAGEEPAQTLRDGVIDNSVVDAAYRSMESGHWEPIEPADRDTR
jgi:predicted dehydrogenase